VGGGQAEFQRRAEALRPRLVGLAYRYLWNADDAEEIVQDALVLAWREAERTPAGQEHRDAWLYRATINLSLNRLRRMQAGPLPAGEMAGGAARPDAREEADELMVRVRIAIRELPDRQQTAILLRDVEGLSYEQAAAILEASPTATRVLVHRARETVRRILLARWPDSFGPER
jgi:RNA polymerase sigma-70 factor (ECF subfamily)